MNSSGLFSHLDETKRVTLETLKVELDSVRKDIASIEEMDVSEAAKNLIIQELEAKIPDIKERMHNFIDVL